MLLEFLLELHVRLYWFRDNQVHHSNDFSDQLHSQEPLNVREAKPHFIFVDELGQLIQRCLRNS